MANSRTDTAPILVRLFRHTSRPKDDQRYLEIVEFRRLNTAVVSDRSEWRRVPMVVLRGCRISIASLRSHVRPRKESRSEGKVIAFHCQRLTRREVPSDTNAQFIKFTSSIEVAYETARVNSDFLVSRFTIGQATCACLMPRGRSRRTCVIQCRRRSAFRIVPSFSSGADIDLKKDTCRYCSMH